MTETGAVRPARSARLAILVDGQLDPFTAKTAVGLLRYRACEVVAVIDRPHAGADLQSLVGTGAGVAIVESVTAARPLKPTALVVGVVTAGGRLPDRLRPAVLEAINAGLDVVAGLHQRLADDRAFAAAAANSGVVLHDVRHTDRTFDIAARRAIGTRAHRVLTVGSDCNVGKMVTALELARTLCDRGLDARPVATGQTGVLITGAGVCVDAVVSDFVAGAAEAITLDQGDADVVVVEGQGALLHPGFSGVTLGLMHGVLPDSMVLVHQPRRTRFRRTDVPLPPLPEVIALHESIMRPLHASRVVGVALNCAGMTETEARREIERVEDLTHRPTTDCIRFGSAVLADAIV